MNMLMGACLAAFIAMQPGSANAESLRCNGQSAYEGDSKLSVLHKCGPPLLKDSFCAPVYVGSTRQLVPEPFANAVVPCQMIEEWLYERGPGNLTATVRFRSSVVQSIIYGQPTP
jgi:hypothetical protein